MQEHHWWLIYKGEDRVMRCSTCGYEQPLDDVTRQFTVSMVEPAVGDQDDE